MTVRPLSAFGVRATVWELSAARKRCGATGSAGGPPASVALRVIADALTDPRLGQAGEPPALPDLPRAYDNAQTLGSRRCGLCGGQGDARRRASTGPSAR